jgi:hypothetical protein
MAKLGDFLSSINYKKNDVFEDDSDAKKDYVPFVVNRTFSYFLDTVMFANEMNRWHNASKRMQYDFLLNAIRPGKRFKPWVKKEQLEDIELIKEYYNYSHKKAEEIYPLITPEQKQYIKQQLYKGGVK